MNYTETEWNPSVECLRCGGSLIVIAHTAPRVRPFHTYRCDDCKDSGSWEALARAVGKNGRR